MASLVGPGWEIQSTMQLRDSLVEPIATLSARVLTSSKSLGAPPIALIVSRNGVLWALLANHTVVKVVMSGEKTVIAGMEDCVGYKDGPALEARFCFSYWLAGIVEQTTGDILFTDPMNHVIRVLRADETHVGTIAGMPETAGHTDGPLNALFNVPTSLALGHDGSIFVSDSGTGCIRRIVNGTVSTLYNAYECGDGHGDPIIFPCGLAYSPKGQLIVSDSIGHTLSRASLERTSFIIGSSKEGFVDGPLDQALLSAPMGISITPAGDILICDSGNHSIRAIIEGQLTTLFAPTDTPRLDAHVASGSTPSALWPRTICLGPHAQVFIADLQGIIVLSPPPQFMPPLPLELVQETITPSPQALNALVREFLVPQTNRLKYLSHIPPEDIITITKATSLLLTRCALIIAQTENVPETSLELIRHTVSVLTEITHHVLSPPPPSSSMTLFGTLTRLKECFDMFPAFFGAAQAQDFKLWQMRAPTV